MDWWWDCRRFWSPDHERISHKDDGRFEQDFDEFHARGLASGGWSTAVHLDGGGSEFGVLRMAISSSRISRRAGLRVEDREWWLVRACFQARRLASGGFRAMVGKWRRTRKRSGGRLYWSVSRDMTLEIWTSAMAILPRGGEKSRGTVIEKDTLIATGGSHSFIRSFIHSADNVKSRLVSRCPLICAISVSDASLAPNYSQPALLVP
jgi:hypothetical protein